MDRAISALDAQHPGLVHLASALAWAPDPGLDLRQRPRGRLPSGPGGVFGVWRPVADPGPGRARHLVLLRALAIRHARLAEGHGGPAPLLSHPVARSRA